MTQQSALNIGGRIDDMWDTVTANMTQQLIITTARKGEVNNMLRLVEDNNNHYGEEGGGGICLILYPNRDDIIWKRYIK